LLVEKFHCDCSSAIFFDSVWANSFHLQLQD